MNEPISPREEFAESLADHEKLQKFDTYTDVEYAIVRVSDGDGLPDRGEFVLYVSNGDGLNSPTASEYESVVNSGTLEMQWDTSPQASDASWIPALERYAKAYIDGMYSEQV